MDQVKCESPEYQQAFKAGYMKGYKVGRKFGTEETKTAYWIVRKYDWYCSNCGTKHEQAHDDFCCKCGYQMSEEAII